ncbi:MAG: bifunctional 2-polyprenyl-6-hydroxyphenol methylase/3-demethylubiquinol 3-O-methyltransferase UbiG [Roseomonas sp.]|nr:bifunctional 2-polyprenyl-6-hydroxyphenol methylase/3-demethylubiquinol 3-O-methyltransferase UbiG [Roseomonas sp.]
MAGIHLSLHAGGDIADTIQISDRGAAEFHDDTGHRRLFSLGGAEKEWPTVAPARGAGQIPGGWVARNPSRRISVRKGIILAEATALGAEIAKFDALAARWWDPNGPMKPLHRMNPVRIGWIAERLARAHGLQPLAGLRVLDVGCGAGLASEALARLGAEVTGMDAAPEALAVARAHAEAGGLAIDYRQGGPEDLADPSGYDAVISLEVIEHVAERAAFLAALARAVRPGGKVFLSTLNRTPRSFLMAKLGAEYVLRLLPIGTHDWRMFVTPAELGAGLRGAGLMVADVAGMEMGLSGAWRITRDTAVNYLMMGEKPG